MKSLSFRKDLIGVQDELLRFAYKLTTDREEANDLLQETSLKALDNEDKYTPDTNFKGWMYTIMRNIFINNYRKVVRDQTFVDQTENLYHLNLPQDSGFESTERAYDLKEMHRVVNALPKEYRVPFAMHVSGFKYREIAEKLNLPLSFETHKVLPSSVDALRKIHDGGIRIVIATGRAAGDLHEIADVPYDGIIALNGADCVLRDGTVIRKHLIPKDDFKKAMEIAKTFDFAVAIELDEGVFVNRLTPTVEQIAKIVEHPIPTVVDIENLFEKKECCQLCFYIDDEMEQKVMSFLPNLSLSRWHPLFADVNVAGISKATGLSVFADYYGIGMTEIMACGDGGNDIPMLEVAGIGVAMAGIFQWTSLGLNQGPPDYESVALTN